MCGIIAGVSCKNITPILLEGLGRLEYRGYDSAGIATINDGAVQRVRAVGKIKNITAKIAENPDCLTGNIGIAHTRWATHGAATENNAHPHLCGEVAVVHNGIIENYQQIKDQLCQQCEFTSETDTEVIACAIDRAFAGDLLDAVSNTVNSLTGAYALGIISSAAPNTLIAARKGSPLVIGIGDGGHFIASDVSALVGLCQDFIFLEDGDIAIMDSNKVAIYDGNKALVSREIHQSNINFVSHELGKHKHYMHKEIFEQPQAVRNALAGRINAQEVLIASFGDGAYDMFNSIKQIQIIACGTSYHAGLVAKYWFEDIVGIPCNADVASEYRYRNPVIASDTLFVAVSQSGETADTLAALQQINTKRQGSATLNTPTLSICNVAESSISRACDLTCLTQAGREIAVASTKSFTTQLVVLALLMLAIAKSHNKLASAHEHRIVKSLHLLPQLISNTLRHEATIQTVAQKFADKQHALFLGRGTMYPIAMEGALKLKEISYIHAEAYPAGELKHGPLALIDDKCQVVAIAPLNDLLIKLKSNLQEVQARGGQMIVFEDELSDVSSAKDFTVIKTTTNVGRITAPITFNISLQLLSYHVALIKGTDVDQPRNLAKSVTVE